MLAPILANKLHCSIMVCRTVKTRLLFLSHQTPCRCALQPRKKVVPMDRTLCRRCQQRQTLQQNLSRLHLGIVDLWRLDGKENRHQEIPSVRASSDRSFEEKLVLDLYYVDQLSWKQIRERFYEITGQLKSVPTLQMRKKRACDRLRIWTDDDVRLPSKRSTIGPTF
jgi:hypothetical protein